MIARQFCLLATAVSLLWVAFFLALRPPLPVPHFAALIGSYLLIALCGEAVRRCPQRWLDDGMLVVTLAVFVAVALSSSVLGWGLLNPSLALLGLLTCIVTSVTSLRRGLLVAGVAAGVVAGLAWKSAGGADAASVPLGTALQLLVVFTGLAGGALVAQVIEHFVSKATAREQRFASLLGIAADAYWETDAEHRVVRVTRQSEPGRFFDLPLPAPVVPWEIPGLAFDPEPLSQLRQRLAAREPLRELAMHWQPDPSAPRRTAHFSGEPRFDADGRFTGHWGVAWDVTPEFQTREALVATEKRYRELFAHLPTALVLHRQGQVIDANPAAITLFGCDGLEAMRGRQLVDLHDSADRARASARVALLEAQPVGYTLDAQDIELNSGGPNPLHLRSSGVRVRADGGDASLSIYVDDTERTRAVERLRRSEALLSHLVATSPDLISVTEMASGRYVMVNAAFTRLTGHAPEDVIGRTAAEVGIWVHEQDRRRLGRELLRHGNARDFVASILRRDGRSLLMRIAGAVFQLDGQAFGVVNGRDITQAEQARVEREAILDNASIGIALTRDGRFAQVNRFLEKMLGWPPDALVGQSVRVLWPDIDLSREGDTTISATLSHSDAADLERTAMRRDGSTFEARVQVKAIDPSDPLGSGTIWIVEDVTQRRRDAQALARARDDAEAASRAKSVFLANTSHEIRTPLNALLGLARLARLPGLDEVRRQQYIEQISDSAETLSAILTDILDLSKIEAGRLTLDDVPFDLPDLLQRVSDAYGTLADTRGLQFVADFDEDLPDVVMGDPVRVRQVLSNYLSNALKFTSQGAIRLVAQRLHGARIRFEVVDTGSGISASLKTRLFQPFVQGDDSTTRRVGGTGLGLSICRELARLMGGEVGVDDAPGGGSVFWAVLPLPPAVEFVRETSSGALDDGLLAGARVLMVEDNAVNMMIAVALLQQWGVDVEQAGDGMQALDAVARAAQGGRPFDAVLMDVQMPVMSGHAAAMALRERYDDRELPIIALTAAALVSERQAALDAGMNEFLTKPIDASRLRSTLARVLASRAGGF